VKKMLKLYRTGALVGAILLPVSAALATGTAEASAAPGGICAGSSCLNAWGGGPYVNAYTGGAFTTNDDFDIVPESNGNVILEFVGGGTWNDRCIGDAKNETGDARASLDPCGNNGQNAGWGTQFEQLPGNGNNSCPSGTSYFYDLHWGGYLGPQKSGVNGSPFYLNKPAPVCFKVT
jgi:hypothetical protein